MNNFSAVSLVPAINFRLFSYFWPVSTTSGKKVITGVDKLFAGVNDSTGNKLYWWQRSALAAKLSPDAEVGHGRRYCHWTQPWKRTKAPHISWSEAPGGRQNYFKPKWHYLVLAASGASDQDVWDVYGCNFSWQFQWHHRQPWPTSAAGDIADLYPSILAAPHLHEKNLKSKISCQTPFKIFTCRTLKISLQSFDVRISTGCRAATSSSRELNCSSVGNTRSLNMLVHCAPPESLIHLKLENKCSSFLRFIRCTVSQASV